MILKQIPNILTFIRLSLILPFVFFIQQQAFVNAFYVFMLAGFTDALDGWLARLWQCQSTIGSFIDPLADKLLIIISYVALAWLGALPIWLVWLVFLRDFTIALGIIAWYILIAKPIVFAPTMLSKLNTLLQLMLVTLCLFELAFFSFAMIIKSSLIMLTALTTIASYFDYVWTWGTKAYDISQKNQ